jgi:hypothetical protein
MQKKVSSGTIAGMSCRFRDLKKGSLYQTGHVGLLSLLRLDQDTRDRVSLWSSWYDGPELWVWEEKLDSGR